MIYLIIDTAFEACHIGLMRDDMMVARKTAPPDMQHDRVLASMTDALLRETGTTIERIGKIIVTTGPGRFTGLRVGIAFARGLALVNKTPISGVLTTDALARDMLDRYPAEKNTAIIVAVKRGESFVGKPNAEIVAVPDADLAAYLKAQGDVLVGGILSPAVRTILQEQGIRVAGDIAAPRLESVAFLGRRDSADKVVRPYYAHSSGT